MSCDPLPGRKRRLPFYARVMYRPRRSSPFRQWIVLLRSPLLGLGQKPRQGLRDADGLFFSQPQRLGPIPPPFLFKKADRGFCLFLPFFRRRRSRLKRDPPRPFADRSERAIFFIRVILPIAAMDATRFLQKEPPFSKKPFPLKRAIHFIACLFPSPFKGIMDEPPCRYSSPSLS